MLEMCQESRWLNWRMVMNYMLLYVIIFLTRLLFGRETGKLCFDMLFFPTLKKQHNNYIIQIWFMSIGALR